jgi:hypothetical protein
MRGISTIAGLLETTPHQHRNRVCMRVLLPHVRSELPGQRDRLSRYSISRGDHTLVRDDVTDRRVQFLVQAADRLLLDLIRDSLPSKDLFICSITVCLRET